MSNAAIKAVEMNTQDVEKVLVEFRRAYADCMMMDVSADDLATALRTRNLTWKSAQPISLDDAARCYGQMVTRYNEFDPEMIADLARAFPEDGITVTPAREYSVGIYLHVPNTPGLRSRVKRFATNHFVADEIGWESSGTLRCWWD